MSPGASSSRPGQSFRLAVLGITIAASASAARGDGKLPAEGDRPATIEISAPPDSREERLGLFAGVGYLGSPGADGATFGAGLRLGLARHFAGSLDLGYGLLGSSVSRQDRWWVIPSVAVVFPAGRLRFDLGLGAGVGTSSGYTSWSSYVAQPFNPIWHYTVPAVRAHAVATLELTPRFDIFLRADFASLIITGPHPGAVDTTWGALWLGVQTRLL